MIIRTATAIKSPQIALFTPNTDLGRGELEDHLNNSGISTNAGTDSACREPVENQNKAAKCAICFRT